MYVILRISVELKWLLAQPHNPFAVKSPISLPAYRVLFCAEVKAREHPMTCIGRHRRETEVEPRHWSGRAWNISLPPGFDHRTDQPIASRCTN